LMRGGMRVRMRMGWCRSRCWIGRRGRILGDSLHLRFGVWNVPGRVVLLQLLPALRKGAVESRFVGLKVICDHGTAVFGHEALCERMRYDFAGKLIANGMDGTLGLWWPSHHRQGRMRGPHSLPSCTMGSVLLAPPVLPIPE